MKISQKRKEVNNNKINMKKGQVIKAALKVFNIHGIENTKISEIAKEADIGVASVYRYFENKTNIVLEVAILQWKNKIELFYDSYSEESLENLNGYERVKEILNIYLILLNKHPEFIAFLEQFDNFIIKEKIDSEILKKYENNILNLKPVVINSIKIGKYDGSIRKDFDENIFYITTTHLLMSLCQKLTLRGSVIKNDCTISKETQVELAIEMALNYIS